MTYEVFYQFGGHSGPYTFEDARAKIGQLMLAGETYAVLAARDSRGLSGYLPVSLYQKVASGQVFACGWDTLIPSRVPSVFKWMGESR